MSLQEVRDLVIIIFGALGTIAIFALLVIGLAVGMTVRGLLRDVRQVLRNGVHPILLSAQETAHNVQGASAFIADTAVAPVIRIYSVYAGLRRGLGVLTGRGRRKR